jgi:hypothetical protein
MCQKLFNKLHNHEPSGKGIYRDQVTNTLLHKCKFPNKLKFFSDFQFQYELQKGCMSKFGATMAALYIVWQTKQI